MHLNPYFYLCRNLTLGFFLLAGLGHIDVANSKVFVASIEVDMKRLVHSIGDHLTCQNLCPRARKFRSILDTHQDIIGHDALVSSWILPDYNEHDTFEGHAEENVTSKVSHPLFTNLVERSDRNEKLMLIG